MDTTVTPPPDDRPYATSAAELHRIADDLATLADQPGDLSLTIYLQPYLLSTHDEDIKSAVDAVAMTLHGKPGEYMEMPGGTYHYVRYGERGAIDLKVFRSVKPPPNGRDAELERLRAENAALTAALSHLGTEGAVAAAKPDTLLLELGEHGRDGGQ
jgi:hypothetical protein